MNPAQFLLTVLRENLDVPVYSQIPETVPDTFVLHTMAGNIPVSNGPATASMDTTFAVSTVSNSNATAFALADRITGIIEDVYDRGVAVKGTGLAYFEATMLPLKQPNVSVVTERLSHQYNAQYRLLFA